VKNTAPVSEAFRKKIAAFPAEKAREANSRIGSIGALARDSHPANATARTAPAASVPATSGLPQPAEVPRTSPQTRPREAPLARARPGRSSGACGPWLSVSRRSASGIASRARGTFSQKIHCQASPWVIAPPSTGPTTAASAVTAPKIPMAQPRRCGGKAALSRASASGMIIAAPAPCTARAAISAPTPGASAHAADAAANTPRPTAKTRRQPRRSPTAAAVISRTANVSV